jgi:YidC/Oxa1 family membrane protein insertase
MIGFIVSLYNILVYQPLLNILVTIYRFLPWQDLGVSVIALTLLVRFVLFPLNSKAFRDQQKLQQLQPKLQEVQKKFQNDKEKQTKATLELYKTEGINPFAGLLPLLIQLPLLIALYRLFFAFGGSHGLPASQLTLLYPFVSAPAGGINPLFLGIVNLSTDRNASAVFAIIAGILQFMQTRQMLGKSSAATSQFARAFQQQSTYLFPLFTVLILWRFPAAIGLYWITTTAFSIWQQTRILKKI